jgi:capsular polysaccharide biosynthesis protein
VDLLTTIRILLRRWFVVVPALLVTAGGAAYAMQAVSPSYEASGAVVLLGPAVAGAPVQGEPNPAPVNPYLEFGGALETTGEILSRALMSADEVDKLYKEGATAAYEVGTGSEGGSPIMNVIATGTDEAAAIRTVGIVAAEVRTELQRRQAAAGAPPSQFIRIENVTIPTKATKMAGSTMRAVAAVLALGLAVSFGLGFMAEAVAVRRAAARSTPNAPAVPTSVGAAPAPPTPPPGPPPPQSGRIPEGSRAWSRGPGGTDSPLDPHVAAARQRDPKR